MGIEPTTSAWKAEVLPLNYTRISLVGVTGLEPATSWSQIRCSTKLSYTPGTQYIIAYAQIIVKRNSLNHAYESIYCSVKYIIYKKRLLFRRTAEYLGAEGRTRTGTSVNPLDFESSASANSATSAFQGSDSFGTSSIILELHPFVNSFLEYFSRNFVLKLSLYNIKKQISQSLSALIIFNITSKLGKHHNNVRPSSQ